MVSQLVQLNAQDDFLSLITHPYIGVKDIYTRIIDHALDYSNSHFALALMNGSGCQFESAGAADFSKVRFFADIEKAWQSSRCWTDATRAMACNWLATMAEADNLPHLLARSTCQDAHNNGGRIFDLLSESASSLWLPLSEQGKTPIGWIGLGAKRENHYTSTSIKSLEAMIASAVCALTRLQLTEHAKKQGLEISWVGRSKTFLKHEQEIRDAARHNHAPILLRGERGSGKELAAYAAHYFSKRREKPFVPVLAPALADTLQVDELFGHEKNSFTGANSSRKGKFLAADGGTLFLDEVGDLPLALQVALLRVLDRGEIQPIGRDLPMRVDVRIVAATNRDLEKLVAEGRFREDLYDRLNVIKVDIPPLRERPEDIPLLAEHFLLKQCVEINRRTSLNRSPICQSCDTDMKVGCATRDFYTGLKGYGWPGNVRELRNLIIRLSTMRSDEVLTDRHLPILSLNGQRKGASDRLSPDSDLTLDTIVRAHIQRILEMAENNQTEAAKMLGVARTTLQAKIKKLGIAND